MSRSAPRRTGRIRFPSPFGEAGEPAMQRNRQLDHTQSGAEMPAGHRNRVDGFLAQLIGNLLEIAVGQFT